MTPLDQSPAVLHELLPLLFQSTLVAACAVGHRAPRDRGKHRQQEHSTPWPALRCVLCPCSRSVLAETATAADQCCVHLQTWKSPLAKCHRSGADTGPRHRFLCKRLFLGPCVPPALCNIRAARQLQQQTPSNHGLFRYRGHNTKQKPARNTADNSDLHACRAICCLGEAPAATTAFTASILRQHRLWLNLLAYHISRILSRISGRLKSPLSAQICPRPAVPTVSCSPAIHHKFSRQRLGRSSRELELNGTHERTQAGRRPLAAAWHDSCCCRWPVIAA